MRNKGVKALVVRVDSPGGSVLASERIRQALLEAKSKKIPVVVSMGSVAASGGYWVSTPADYIYAEPSTITGSIGVFGILPSFQGTLAKLGVGADGVKTTPLSGEPDLLKGPSPEASQLIQTGVKAMYGRFLNIVAQSRHKTPQQVDQIAQGRVWDGGTAHQLGLVDGFGGMSDAIAKAAQLAGLGNERGVRYLERQPTFRDQLIDALSDGDSEMRRRPPMPSRCSRVGRSSSSRLRSMKSSRSCRSEHPGTVPGMRLGRSGAAAQAARSEPAGVAESLARLTYLTLGEYQCVTVSLRLRSPAVRPHSPKTPSPNGPSPPMRHSLQAMPCRAAEARPATRRSQPLMSRPVPVIWSRARADDKRLPADRDHRPGKSSAARLP